MAEQPEPAPELTPAPPPAKVPVRVGLVPTTIDEAWRLAQMFARSGLVPESFRGKPDDVLVAIQMGAELGFAPMQALQSIAVINGRPAVWGDGLLALIMQSPLYGEHVEAFEVNGERVEKLSADDLRLDTTAAVCTFWRKGKDVEVTRRFTVAQAKRAKLFGKNTWIEYPDRMLQMRARTFAARDAFPDVLRGIGSAEEIATIPAEATPRPVPTVRRLSSVPPPPPPREAAREAVRERGELIYEIGPTTVIRIESAIAGFVAILGDETAIYVDEAAATELGAFVGTEHRLVFAVERLDNHNANRMIAYEVRS